MSSLLEAIQFKNNNLVLRDRSLLLRRPWTTVKTVKSIFLLFVGLKIIKNSSRQIRARLTEIKWASSPIYTRTWCDLHLLTTSKWAYANRSRPWYVICSSYIEHTGESFLVPTGNRFNLKILIYWKLVKEQYPSNQKVVVLHFEIARFHLSLDPSLWRCWLEK